MLARTDPLLAGLSAARDRLSARGYRPKTVLLGLAGLIGFVLLSGWDGVTGRRTAWTQTAPVAGALVSYLLAAHACQSLRSYRLKVGLFALTNLAGITVLFSLNGGRRLACALLAVYVALVSFHYLTMRLFAARERWLPWLAFLSPIAALVLVKYVPFVWEPLWGILPARQSVTAAGLFVGLSYMAFRLSHLVLEVRNGVVERPSFWEYLGFAFFIPTLVVGPINPYSVHRRSLSEPDSVEAPAARALARILVGVTKFQFLGNIFNQLSYTGLMLDGHPHSLLDLAVAAVAYHLYLYCNFSGICDIGIGAAGLLGIHVKENFQNPFAARNVKEYWNRWHITLGAYMRDMVFAPLSKFLAGRMGARHTHHSIAIAIFVVFILVGVWHGVGWHYALYGVTQAVGVAANHYYTRWLKKRLGPDGFRAYNENAFVRAVAVGVTFAYTSACLFVFANDFSDMERILRALR